MISQIIHTVKLSIRNSNALFALIVLGLMMLTAVTFIGNRLLFANQPDIENVFSIIWTVVLGVILYRLMLYIAPTKNPTRAEWRRNFYGGMIFLCELLAVVALVQILGRALPSSQGLPLALATFAIAFLLARFVYPRSRRLISPAFTNRFPSLPMRETRKATEADVV